MKLSLVQKFITRLANLEFQINGRFRCFRIQGFDIRNVMIYLKLVSVNLSRFEDTKRQNS